jgi:TolA-binding protein
MTKRVQTTSSTRAAASSAQVARRSLVLCGVLLAIVVAGKQVPRGLQRLETLRSANTPVIVVQPIDTLLRAVEAAADTGGTGEVARLCAAILDQYPDHPVAEPALLRLVQARIRLDDERGAEAAMQMLRSRFPTSRLLTEALLDVASWRYQRGAYQEAAHAYTDLVALVTSGDGSKAGEDTAPEPVIWRSKALWNAHKRAERSRTEIERLARYNQALSYENAKQHDSALRAYDRFVSRFPQDAFVPEARFRMANMLIAERRWQEALVHYRAVYDDPLAPVAFRCESAYRAGRALQAARRFEEAIVAYRVAVPLRPRDNEFRFAAMGELAQLIEPRDRQGALALYRELAGANVSPQVRAVALQRLEANAAPAAATRR